ncbi:MAG: phosphoglycerate dehydrogenase [Gammaproteobacteria bacterium]|jgi:D-3-phosphoglycerate dehydrogenase
MKKRILIADKISKAGVDYLQSQPDFVVDIEHGLDEAGLCAKIPGYDAVLVRSAVKITEKVINAADKLKVIGRAGIGVDNINVEKATEKGIVVMNTPDANATTTAELTFAHILSLSRSLPAADKSVRTGKWERSKFMGAELANKTLGIVGYGNIGRIVATRAKAFKMKVIAYDPFVTAEAFEKEGVTPSDVDGLVKKSDYITLHCPVNDKTRGIISAERIKLMKPNTRIINVARGGLIDENALYEALKSGNIAGAALDVFENEPPVDSPLLELDNTVFTPHLGASTDEAQTAAGSELASQIVIYLQSGEPINALNLPPVSSEELVKLQPYMVLSNRLGRLLGNMVDEPITQLDVTLCGEASQRDMRSIAVESLVGVLSVRMSAPVNSVNAISRALKNGTKLKESSCEDHPSYHATVSLTAHHGDQKSTVVEGALFDHKHPRLVRINNYAIEAVLKGHMLVTSHNDTPGVVAAISTILAKKEINISSMQLGVVNGGNKAVAMIGISIPLDSEAIHELSELDAINKVMQVSL